jgi:hypothetical protein
MKKLLTVLSVITILLSTATVSACDNHYTDTTPPEVPRYINSPENICAQYYWVGGERFQRNCIHYYMVDNYGTGSIDTCETRETCVDDNVRTRIEEVIKNLEDVLSELEEDSDLRRYKVELSFGRDGVFATEEKTYDYNK